MRCVLSIVALLVFGLVAASSFVHATTMQNVHGDAVEAQSDQPAIDAYRRGDLETAKSLWLARLDPSAGPLSNAERARIHYDLGNVAFRRNEVLEAVGWYSASLRLRPRDADTWQNLEHARAEAKLEPADRGDLSATLRRLLTALTPAESRWLVIGATLAWAIVLAGEALRGGRTWRRLAWIGTCFVLVSTPPWIYSVARSHRDPVLAIAADKLHLKSEPRPDAAVIADVDAGAEIERVDALPAWTKVELDNGVTGWVENGGVFELTR